MLNDLFIAVETTKVSLDCDAPVSNVGKGPAKPYHLGYHLYDALCAPKITKTSNGLYFANFDDIEFRLAENIVSNKDGTIWTVEIRKGIKSNYGNELTAQDIEWSYKRLLRMQAIGMWRAFNIAGILNENGIKIISDYKIEFHLSGPNKVFPRFLCFATGAIIDATEAQKRVTDKDPNCLEFLAENQCGFGPWQVDEWNDEILKLIPRNNGIFELSPLNHVTYVSAPTREDALNLFKNNNVNLLAGLYPDEAIEINNYGSLLKARTNHSFLELNADLPPFNDLWLRQHIQINIDRKKIVDAGYLGFAEEQKSILQPNTPEYNEDAFNNFTHEMEKKEKYEQKNSETEIILAIPSSNEARRIAKEVESTFKKFNMITKIVEFKNIEENMIPHAYLRGDCSHGICDSFYDIALDFAPPRGMPGRSFQVTRRSSALKELRATSIKLKKIKLKELDYEILSFAETVPVAGHYYLLGYNQEINPWIFTQEYLPMISLMWSAARYVLAPVR